ncbi:MAG: hypothetical protein ABS944_06145 [Solibacillus sp.]|jgi:hypothetical protein|uniref:hypothetical protein n=1 Tax=unclassified Solibacillus TaxID=2637870 RepID=UPI0030FAD09D
MKEENKENNQYKKMDNPDLLNTDKESIFDRDEQMKFVDPIPVEELNDKVKDEKNKSKTKETSGSERKNRPE